MQLISYPGDSLHQIGPYIGKIRPPLARKLVMSYSKEGDWIWDPFCGSGTIPLESKLLSRNVIASDINPYACALTRAKLHAPRDQEIPLKQLPRSIKELGQVNQTIYLDIPKWVKSFFHKRTLFETYSLMTDFINKKQYFNVGCLLDILHHQRPGFLSYPASHLIPYLRDKRYPRELYPEAYDYRDPIIRLESKIRRVFKSPPPPLTSHFKVFLKSTMNKFLPDEFIDVIITSPPYMDALDYARDNRLRLWFLGVTEYKLIKKYEIGRITTFEEDMTRSLNVMSRVLKHNGICILILGDVTRSGRTHDVPMMISNLVRSKIKGLRLEDKWVEYIPDYRRSRRNGRATKKELILFFRKK